MGTTSLEPVLLPCQPSPPHFGPNLKYHTIDKGMMVSA